MELTRKLAKNIFFGLFDFLGVPILGGGSYPWRGFTLAFHGDSWGKGRGLMCGSMPHWPCLLVYKKEFRKGLEYVAEAICEAPVSR